jgi:hypothetical protein
LLPCCRRSRPRPTRRFSCSILTASRGRWLSQFMAPANTFMDISRLEGNGARRSNDRHNHGLPSPACPSIGSSSVPMLPISRWRQPS